MQYINKYVHTQYIYNTYVHKQYIYNTYVYTQYIYNTYVHTQYINNTYVHTQYIYNTYVYTHHFCNTHVHTKTYCHFHLDRQKHRYIKTTTCQHFTPKKNIIAANTLLVNTERGLMMSWRKVPLVVQKMVIAPKYLGTNKIFLIILMLPSFKCSGVRVSQSFVCCVVFCKSLFVLLYFSYWSFYCVYFSDLRLLITPLLSSHICRCFYMPLVSKISILFFSLTLPCIESGLWLDLFLLFGFPYHCPLL